MAFSGDGGPTMLVGDLLTLKQLNLPVKVIIFNNRPLGFIELEHKSTGILSSGTLLENPEFAAMAESLGIKGLRSTNPNTLKASWPKLWRSSRVVIDAVVTHLELVVPPKITAEMAKGFMFYMVRPYLAAKRMRCWRWPRPTSGAD
ncbi:thiamine pyrophosphate-dependent enzyme [Pseudomonas petrae]|uniref:Thiamine pyrophosphate-dependent enzyme n=1 Tax=Pseudomonas petrae TaxID=2912190 RepID=A0ABS9ICG8_9PSED|nr:thiamine pyrophosphate-dependent enzyme [Pseudomonas petrae]